LLCNRTAIDPAPLREKAKAKAKATATATAKTQSYSGPVVNPGPYDEEVIPRFLKAFAKD
jgi:hypothetical protein